MVKITPAHDPNDWAIGQRHNLPIINILNADGTLNEEVPQKYRNMDVESARKLVVKDLTESDYLIEQKAHNHEVGHCYPLFYCDRTIFKRTMVRLNAING